MGGEEEDRVGVKVRDEDREAVNTVHHVDTAPPRKIWQGLKVSGSHWYVVVVVRM